MHHALLSMLPAVRWPLASLEIIPGLLHTGFMRAALAYNVYHAVLSMLLAVCRRLAFEMEGRLHSAFFTEAPHFRDNLVRRNASSLTASAERLQLHGSR